MELDDKQLVTRAQAGDRHAFEALVRKYQRRIFRLAYGMLKNQEDAMDVAQDAFVRVHQHLDRFKGDAAFYTWLYRITTNLCIDRIRRNRGEQVEYEDGLAREDHTASELGLRRPAAATNPAKATLRHELGEQIAAALAELPEKHREILLLREIEGLSYEELAQTLEIKKGTVMSRLFHARKKMQAILASYLSPEELARLQGDPAKETA
ncbi:MAG: sigma-70 family RNA polymerase sigma factor [Deltaproteobacteria bacterium]|nr:sigma-70 family RNA polymerase sigma factor [Deltaproteobacteria bacterium]